jgi:single-stranded-DNA-specific exonuclease
VFDALEFSSDLLYKHGGHKAAAGFSLPAANLENFRLRLSEFANQCLEVQHLKPLLKIDGQINFCQINQDLFQQLNILHPCGIENPDPIFWTPQVRVVEQQMIGKGGIKLTLAQIIDNTRYEIRALAWRWGDYFPLPFTIDIAYKLRENNFNGANDIELELVGVRLPQ